MKVNLLISDLQDGGPLRMDHDVRVDGHLVTGVSDSRLFPDSVELDVATRGRNFLSGSFDEKSALLANVIHQGYEAQRNSPLTGYTTPGEGEIEWLASWLVSEGWTLPEPQEHGK